MESLRSAYDSFASMLQAALDPTGKMPRNVEIKAKVPDVELLETVVYELTDSLGTVIHQEDVFFQVASGRLKLRIVNCDSTLGNALGVIGTVKKQRRLYFYGQTRIHLDDVKGLGSFMELEVVLDEGQTAEEGEKIAKELMEKLGVNQADLVAVAYMDLLLQKSHPPVAPGL